MGKEMKSIDKAKLDKIKKFHASNRTDPVVNFVLDNMTRFIVGKKTATFDEANQGIFDSVETLHESIRSINPLALTFEDASDVMIKIGGQDGKGEII